MNLNMFKKFLDQEMYESKPCKYGHCGPDGKNVRRVNGGCWACRCGLPNEPYNYIFTNVIPRRLPKSESLTEEEKRKLRSEASSRWNKRNREKTRQYVRKYSNKPENKAKKKVKDKNWYSELPEDERKKLNERSKAYYWRKKAEKQEFLKTEGQILGFGSEILVVIQIPPTQG